MKTIAIINMKGGCAKTTTSVNMGYILAEDYDKKVLIIDNDKQGNLSKACGVWNDEAPSFADVLTGDKTLTDVMQLGANGNIAVVPANMTLLTANLEVIKNEEIDQVTILSKELEKVKDVFDYCIIDCPPDINISVINALVAADEVIIPIKIDGYAFDGMKELEERVRSHESLCLRQSVPEAEAAPEFRLPKHHHSASPQAQEVLPPSSPQAVHRTGNRCRYRRRLSFCY